MKRIMVLAILAVALRFSPPPPSPNYLLGLSRASSCFTFSGESVGSFGTGTVGIFILGRK
jgi:hypothetical protein